MAMYDDIIDLPRLREAVGGIGDSEDVLLSAHRSAAVDWLSRWVGRTIIDRANVRTDHHDFVYCQSPERIGFTLPDIKSGTLSISYNANTAKPTGQGSETLEIDTDDSRVFLTHEEVWIHPPEGEYWCNLMRFNYPVPILTASCGMNASDIPPVWKDAVALIVRALYDGTAYDNLSEMSVLKMILRPWVPVVAGARR
ncbi:MAG: hypothetical protein ISN29_12730 [Gammaproteobacteria bacterium AqS3]|nr:hypothetical protein [Gammaproteobacteria bacterium AqS3]